MIHVMDSSALLALTRGELGFETAADVTQVAGRARQAHRRDLARRKPLEDFVQTERGDFAVCVKFQAATGGARQQGELSPLRMKAVEGKNLHKVGDPRKPLV